VISSSQRPLPTQHTTNIRVVYPRPKRDSNPQSQKPSRRIILPLDALYSDLLAASLNKKREMHFFDFFAVTDLTMTFANRCINGDRGQCWCRGSQVDHHRSVGWAARPGVNWISAQLRDPSSHLSVPTPFSLQPLCHQF